nr:retrovirus-related Pol polyprotein from transposon TNT 1-94 [Tanacetum cinerariifolium]GFA19897.1 retrovirus-related Pol polyprotein from transposon TNT 1-94 [Tanacetum cinerariifolium]
MLTRSMTAKLAAVSASECLFADFISEIEPKKIAIGSKWVFRNKKDEHGIVTKNKEILVAQGYNQEERIDYDETFASVARIYSASPKESHLTAVKRIFRYLKGTLSIGLWYPKCSGFDLKGYSDSDYAGCNMD